MSDADWTTKPPTEPGYWWRRRFRMLDHSDNPRPHVVSVYTRDGSLWDDFGEIPTAGEDHIEWYPIPIPEPPRKEPSE